MNHSSDYNDILDVKKYRNIWVKKKLPFKKSSYLIELEPLFWNSQRRQQLKLSEQWFFWLYDLLW